MWEGAEVDRKKRWRDNMKEVMKKLTEDMTQDRTHWMAKIMAGPAQGAIQVLRNIFFLEIGPPPTPS